MLLRMGISVSWTDFLANQTTGLRPESASMSLSKKVIPAAPLHADQRGTGGKPGNLDFAMINVVRGRKLADGGGGSNT